MGSPRSVWTTLGLPPPTACVLSLSTLLRLQVALKGNFPKQVLGFVHFPRLSCSGSGFGVLHKGTDLVGPEFCALPRSEELRWPGAWRVHYSRWAVCLNHLPDPSCSVPGCTMRVPSQVCSVSHLGSWSQAVTLLADVNCPESQKEFVSNWEPSHSGCYLWGQDCLLPSGSGCRPPASLPPVGDGPVHSRLALLWHSLNPFYLWTSQALP